MTTILQIETSTQVCSAAISIDGETIAVKEQTGQNIHAGSLTLFIEEVMKKSSISYSDLNAVAVSKGPGSYTGLRIGVSTAKGICFGMDVPLIAVDTLKLMANGFLNLIDNYKGLVCPMIDARRMEVYTSTYDGKLNLIAPVEALIVDKHSFDMQFNQNIVTFIGDGSFKCKDLLPNSNALFSDLNFNSASNMSALAMHSFSLKNFEDLAYFEPYYLKDFVLTPSKKMV